MNDKFEVLGQLIDSLDNLANGLNIPMPAEFHINQLKKLLPEKVEELKNIYVEITNDNPWE